MWLLTGCLVHPVPAGVPEVAEAPRVVGAAPVMAPTTHIDEGGLRELLADPAQPTLINFWASWCGPCLDELPTLGLVADRRPDVAVVLVNLDAATRSPDELLRARQVTLRSLQLAEPDPSAVMARVVPGWDDSIPLTLLVLPGGTIGATFRGQAEPDTLLYELPRAP